MNITNNNYEEFLIDHLHGELKGDLLNEMELFLQNNPSIKEEFELLQQTILVPDEKIIYENKDLLLKKEKSTPFFITYKRPLSIAASVVGIVLATYLFTKNENETIIVAKQQQTITTPIINTNEDTISKTQTIANNNTFNNNQIINKVVTTKKISSSTFHKTKDEIPMNSVVKEMPKQKEINIEQKKENSPQVVVENPIVENKIKEELPILVETNNEEILVANNTSSNGAIVLTEEKQPRLFSFLNKISKINKKVKQTKENLANTEVTVMVGNKKIINLNHF